MARMPLLLARMLAASLLATLLPVLCAHGQTAATSPAPIEVGFSGLQNLEASFDFEGYEATGESLPKGWLKSSLPGGKFPSYNVGQLAADQAHGGKWSFKFALDASNVAYTYTDTIPVNPNNDYLLTGYVRTEKLRVARAQARIYFVDAAGNLIPGTLCISEPFGAPDGLSDGKWQSFSIRLRGSFPTAANMRITLALVQPNVWQGKECKDIYQQDIEGLAWWDDLSVYRLPRIALTTNAPGNVFAPQDTPSLNVQLQGMGESDFSAVLTVRDALGSIASQQVLDIDPSKDSNELEVPLPKLPVGIYTGELAISAADKVLAHEYCRFARLSEVPLNGKSRLGLDAADVPGRQWADLLQLSGLLRASALKLSAWPSLEPQKDPLTMQQMLAEMNGRAMLPILVFGQLPPSKPDEPALTGTLTDALAQGNESLHQSMSLVLAQYGLLADAWQVGRTGDEDMLWSSNLPAAQANARLWVRKLLTRENMIQGWHASYEYDMPAKGPLSLLIPSSGLPERIPAQLANFPGRVHDVHLELQDLDVDRLNRLSDFALRYAYTRAAGMENIFIRPPWRLDAQQRIEPDEAMFAVRTLAAYLGDAQYVGPIRLDDAAVALLFRRAGEGVMLVYDRPSEERTDDVLISLPPDAYAVDLWGRKSPLPRQDGQAVLRPSPMPIIVAGCDSGPLALRASLGLTPLTVPSTYEDHASELHFTNPYDQPITGQVQVTGPEGWAITPRVQRFNLAAGETFKGKLTIRFPYNASIGQKQMDVAVTIDNRTSWSVTAPTFMYLDLEGVAFDAIQSVGSDGALEVQEIITNRTEKNISFQCFVNAPERPRQNRVVKDLPPGATAVKMFRFPNFATLHGLQVLAGLRELGGSAILNRSIAVK